MTVRDANDLFDLPTISLEEATARLPGFSSQPIAPEASGERAPPSFVFGPYSAEAAAFFAGDRYIWQISVHVGRDVAVLGPWPDAGALLLAGGYSFTCHQIYLNGDTDAARGYIRGLRAGLADGSRTLRRIDGTAVLLAGIGHQIYGHWLVDFLPKLHVLARAGYDCTALRFLYPTNTPGYGRALLDLVGIGEAQLIPYDPETECLLAETLIVPTNVRTYARTTPLFAEAIADLNARIDRHALIPPSPAGEKIFLSRARSGRDSRLLVNEAHIVKRLTAEGFSIVYPEQLTLPEQVAMFRHARAIIGPYGSALHGSIFSRAGTVVCALQSESPPSFENLQSGIGDALGQPTGYIFGPAAEAPPPYFSAFTIEEAALDACLTARFPWR